MDFFRASIRSRASYILLSASEIAVSHLVALLAVSDNRSACLAIKKCFLSYHKRDSIPPMTDEDYRRAMETAIEELSALMEEREELDDRREKMNTRINVLRDGIVGLSSMLGEDPFTQRPELFPNLIDPDTGLTNAVRDAMRSLDRYASTVDIREALKDAGYNITKYRNPLSAIQQVLTRLVERGVVEKHEDAEKKLYKLRATVRVPGGTSANDATAAMGKALQAVGKLGSPGAGAGALFRQTAEERQKAAEARQSRPVAKPGHRADPPPADSEQPGAIPIPTLRRPSRGLGTLREQAEEAAKKEGKK